MHDQHIMICRKQAPYELLDDQLPHDIPGVIKLQRVLTHLTGRTYLHEMVIACPIDRTPLVLFKDCQLSCVTRNMRNYAARITYPTMSDIEFREYVGWNNNASAIIFDKPVKSFIRDIVMIKLLPQNTSQHRSTTMFDVKNDRTKLIWYCTSCIIIETAEYDLLCEQCNDSYVFALGQYFMLHKMCDIVDVRSEIWSTYLMLV